jgi:hypothetical protein
MREALQRPVEAGLSLPSSSDLLPSLARVLCSARFAFFGVHSRFSTASLRRAPVKLGATWVEVPPVELDGSRPKRGVREEAVRLNLKRDADGTVGLQRR